jgi:hypothetical protein
VAGITRPKDKILDGQSIVPLLESHSLPVKPIFWDFPIYLPVNKHSNGKDKQWGDGCFRTRPGASVRMGPWVLQEYYEDNHLELYNLDIDLGQRKNLATVYPEKTRELYDMLAQWRKKINAPIPSKPNPKYQPGGCPVNTILEW